MRPATRGEIQLRDLAIRLLAERGIEQGNITTFADRGVEVTKFPAPYGAEGLAINHARPGKRAVSVFCMHWNGKETTTLCHVTGSWQELLKQLALEKIEAA